MATFVSGYISDLSPVKDNIKLRVRILRAWLQPLYNNQQIKNMEMIVMDGHMLLVKLFRVRISIIMIKIEKQKKPVTLIDDELFANQPSEQSENTATKISTASKNSTTDTFVNKHPIRNIDALLDVEQGVQFVIVGTVIALQKDEVSYLSCDSIDKTERGFAIDEAVFSPKFINGLKFSGVSNHRLALKVGVPIMLLRNIDQANGLCNGTRLQVLRLTRTSIQAKIINGTHFGKELIILRLRITPSDKRLPIKIVEVTNRGLKRILEMTIGENRALWSDKLEDALWVFRTAFKTPVGCTPYRLVYGKACHLPLELEHKAFSALKHANFDLKTVSDHRKLQLNEPSELRDQAYENFLIYKERTKKLHDAKIKNRIFNVGDQVLLFNSRLKIFSGKLKSRWSGPFIIFEIYPYRTAKLVHPDGCNFKVNCHRLKHYHGEDPPPLEIPDIQTFPKDN
nr:reverse transcriptase domain-containing protein [Tanacetum cinerariifolium]